MKTHLWTLMAAGLGLAAVPGAHAQSFGGFVPGDLVVSSSVYQYTGAVAGLTVGQSLPGGGKAVNNGQYPGVFNNDTPDASFGVTAPIYLDQYNVSQTVGVFSATNQGELAIPTSDVVTSFSSKSELALNLSTDGTALTFMGYQAPVGALDVSNSTTPGAPDPNNPDTATPTYREVAQVSASGNVQVTTTNAYSGNNGRAAILDSAANEYFTVGNAGNGGTPPATDPVALGAGAQIITPNPGGTTTPEPTQAGSFSVGQTNPATGQPYSTSTKDKPSKDNNFRGETIFDNTLYVTKGSGSNGINTVYQVGAAGTLPTSGSTTITVLPGFNSHLATSNGSSTPSNFTPFGLFFANADTLYVTDEGIQSTSDTLANNTSAGLEKYSLVNGAWQLDYTLQDGLNLDTPYTVAGSNDGVAGTYTTATDGLRNLTGKVNADGTVTLYAITSTVSNSGDQGADPNELVAINDTLGDTTLPTTEAFQTLETASYGEILRGVSFAPQASAAPEPSQVGMLALMGIGLGGLLLRARRKSAA